MSMKCFHYSFKISKCCTYLLLVGILNINRDINRYLLFELNLIV